MSGFTTSIAAQHQDRLLDAARRHRLGREIARPSRPARLVLRWSRPRPAAVQPC